MERQSVIVDHTHTRTHAHTHLRLDAHDAVLGVVVTVEVAHAACDILLVDLGAGVHDDVEELGVGREVPHGFGGKEAREDGELLRRVGVIGRAQQRLILGRDAEVARLEVRKIGDEDVLAEGRETWVPCGAGSKVLVDLSGGETCVCGCRVEAGSGVREGLRGMWRV
jgi:hypothetical protein